MTRDRGYPDWLVLSARLLAQPSCGQVTIVQNRCLIVFPCGYVKILQPVAICTVIFVTFPPWSSQMTIILITNALYHIRYKNSEYGFKRKNPHGLITANINITNRKWKTPLLYGRKPYRIPKVEWHLPWCVSKNTWAVANTTVDIHIIQSICPTVTVLSKHKGTVSKAQ